MTALEGHSQQKSTPKKRSGPKGEGASEEKRWVRRAGAGGRVQEFLKEWRWPGRVSAGSPANIFSKKRYDGNLKAGHIRSQGSEALSLYPVMAFWVRDVAMPLFPTCEMACRTFLCCCKVLDVLANLSRGFGDPATLLRRVQRFLEKFRATWPGESMRPKYHWMLHYAPALARHGYMVNCFVHERKHKYVRRYGNDVFNLPAYEKSLMAELTCHQLANLGDESLLSFLPGLIKPHAAPKKLKDFLSQELGLAPGVAVETSQQLRYDEMGICAVKDVVYVRNGATMEAGEVWAFAQALGQTVALVSLWTLIEDDGSGSPLWRSTRNPILILASDIVCDVIWKDCGSNVARTLTPAWL